MISDLAFPRMRRLEMRYQPLHIVSQRVITEFASFLRKLIESLEEFWFDSYQEKSSIDSIFKFMPALKRIRMPLLSSYITEHTMSEGQNMETRIGDALCPPLEEVELARLHQNAKQGLLVVGYTEEMAPEVWIAAEEMIRSRCMPRTSSDR